VIIALIGGLILGVIAGIGIYIFDRHVIGSLVATLVGFFCGFLLSFGALLNLRGGI